MLQARRDRTPGRRFSVGVTSGTVQGLEAPIGVSLMQAATGAGVTGVVAECGGSAICATCHVFVDPGWVENLPPPQSNDLAMLAYTAVARQPNSRLSCQVQLTADLQGLVVRVPERQY